MIKDTNKNELRSMDDDFVDYFIEETRKDISNDYHELNSIEFIITDDKNITTIKNYLSTNTSLKLLNQTHNHKEYKLNHLDDYLSLFNDEKGIFVQKAFAPLGSDFLKLVSYEDKLILSVYGIVDTRNINRKNGYIGDIRDMEKHFETMLTDKSVTRNIKIKILTRIIDLIYKNKMQDNVTISNISFLRELTDDLCDTNINGIYQDILNIDFKDIHYSQEVSTYTAEIKHPNNLVDVNGYSVEIVCKNLRDAIKSKFVNLKGLFVEFSDGKYYIIANSNCKKSWSKAVMVKNEQFIFYPSISNSYYSISTIAQEQYSIQLQDSAKATDFDTTWMIENQNLYYTGTEQPVNDRRVYKKVDSAILYTQSKLVASLNVKDINFSLSDNIDLLINKIDDIPANINKKALTDAKILIAPNKVASSLRHYFDKLN